MGLIIITLLIITVAVLVFYLNSYKGKSGKKIKGNHYNLLTLIISLIVTTVILAILFDFTGLDFDSKVVIFIIGFILSSIFLVWFWLKKSKIFIEEQTGQTQTNDSTISKDKEDIQQNGNGHADASQQTSTPKRGKLFDEQYTQVDNPKTDNKNSDKDHKKIPWRFRRGFLGIARNIEKRQIRNRRDTEEDFLAFRLEILDEVGNVVQIIPVEIRALEVSGRLMDGDKIIVKGRIRRRSGILHPRAILNLKTHELIKSRDVSLFSTTSGCLLGLIFTASVIGIPVGIIMAMDDNPSGGLLIVLSAVAMILTMYFARKLKY